MSPVVLLFSLANALGVSLAQASDDGRTVNGMKKPKACNLNVFEVPSSYKEAKAIHTLTGAWDYTGSAWWIDVALAPTWLAVPIGPILTGMLYYSRLPEGHSGSQTSKRVQVRNNQEKSESWYKNEMTELQDDCFEYLRDNFRDQITFDDGHVTFTRNYFCGTPYTQHHESSNQLAIDVYYGEPVFNTPDRAQALIDKKCQILQTDCFAAATEDAEFNWIDHKKLELGCHL